MININGSFDDNKPIQTPLQSSNNCSSSSNSNGSIFLSFNDDNGIVEKKDIQFANKESKEIAAPLLTFLDKYCDGKHKWTSALSDTIKNVIQHFNESFENPDKDTNIEKSEQGVTVTDSNGKIKFLMQSSYNKNLGSVIYSTSDGKCGNMYIQYDNNNILKSYSDKINNSEEMTSSTNAYFRKDGTIREKSYFVKGNVDEKFNYDGNEKLILKTTKLLSKDNDAKKIVKERFDGDNSCRETYDIKYYGLNEEKEITSRVIYDSENNELIRTDYQNKKVVNFADNRKQEEKPVFDKTKLNGKFDNPVKQGLSGVCYMVGVANSMILSNNKDNLEVLNDCVSYDKEKGIGTVSFKGLNRTYSFPVSEIEKHMARLGTEDPDFPLLALGYEQFLLEDDGDNIDHAMEAQAENAKNDEQRNAVKVVAKLAPKSKTIDAGSPSDFYFAITGKEMIVDEVSDESFNKAKDALNNGGIVNACTIPSDINDEFVNNHNYSVLKIDGENVTLYEPNECKEIVCSVEKFKQRFAGIFYN